MELLEGSPENINDRIEREQKVYQFLEQLGIPFLRTDHEPADTMEACNEIDKILEVVICKNLFLCNRQKTKYYLLMMPGDKVFKTKELSAQIGSARLSFGSAEDMERLLKVTPGSVSVMGLMNDEQNIVTLLMDEDVLKGEYFGCHPCINTSSLKIRTKDIMDVFLPAVHHEPVIVHLVGSEE